MKKIQVYNKILMFLSLKSNRKQYLIFLRFFYYYKSNQVTYYIYRRCWIAKCRNVVFIYVYIPHTCVRIHTRMYYSFFPIQIALLHNKNANCLLRELHHTLFVVTDLIVNKYMCSSIGATLK